MRVQLTTSSNCDCPSVTNNPKPSQLNCDRLAPFYHPLETLTFGRALQNARCAFLPQVTSARRAILCGDGDGRFLARLLQINPIVTIDFVDLSSRMIELAQRRAARLGPSFLARVRFLRQDIAHFEPPPGGYDLLATHFFLDCFAQREILSAVSRIASWAAPGAHWLVTDFREAPTPLRRLYTRAAIRTLYAAFDFATGLSVTELPRYTEALAASGCIPKNERITLGGLLYSSLWQCPGA